MKIVIFGAGSIGNYIGGKLIAAGSDVVLYGREYQQKIIREYGLHLTSYTGENIQISSEQVTYSTQLECLSQADIIIVCVKSYATEQALAEIEEFANKNASIISLQNGVYNEYTLKQRLPEWETAGAMVPYNVVNKGEGRFHRGTEGTLIFEKTYLTGLFVQQCKQAGLEATLSENIKGVLWGKLLMNLNNALNVLSNLPLKQQLADRNYRRALALCIEEALSVYKVANINPAQVGKVPPKHIARILKLPNSIFEFLAKGMLQIDPEARSSMWEDLNNQRNSEIDYLNGEIVKLADSHSTHAPINTEVVRLVNAAFKNNQSPQLDGAALLDLLNR